jgi:hypothetical protein
MTTLDSTVFGVATSGAGGGNGVVKYKPGLVVEYGDEVKSMKDLDVYVRWTKSPVMLQMTKDPADDYENFKSSTGLCPVGGTTSYIKDDTDNITPYLVRYKGCLYVYNTSSLSDTIDLTNTIYNGVIDEKFIQKLPGDVNSGRALAGEPYVLSSGSAVGDVTPNKDVVFYTNATSANSSGAAIPKQLRGKPYRAARQICSHHGMSARLQATRRKHSIKFPIRWLRAVHLNLQKAIAQTVMQRAGMLMCSRVARRALTSAIRLHQSRRWATAEVQDGQVQSQIQSSPSLGMTL